MLYFRIDPSDLERALSQKVERAKLTSDELQQISAEMIRRINMRTVEGRDYRGKQFEPYSDAYAEYREEEGRVTDIVDLTFTGNMLAALMPRSNDEQAIVGWTSAAEKRKARGHNEGLGNLPERRFVDIQEGGSEAEVLAELAVKLMSKKL